MPTSLESGADARALTALTRRWHPVGYSTEITQQPFGTTLLGEPVVVWRDETGRPHAMRDLCIHRGTALSLGRVERSEIICAYHGWRFTADGKCSRIPQLTDSSQIPPKARVDAYHCQERYGLVWVALLSLLEQPERPLAQVPELESGEWTVVETGPFSWQTNASRQVENFTDFGHFPWVHPGLLGDPDRPEVPPHNVRTEGDVLHYEVVRPEAPNSEEFPVFSMPDRSSPSGEAITSCISLRSCCAWVGAGAGNGLFFCPQPIKEDQCRGYCIIGRNYNFEQPASVLQEFERVIFSQDQRIAESQRPDKVPFDLAAELHLKFDAVAVAYRRAMKANGLG
jgi:vanillate O-demethylase monooxygenase subunit